MVIKCLEEKKIDSRMLSKHCGDDVKAYWDQRFQNYVIYWRGKQVLEFARGKKINPQQVKRHIHRIKNNKIEDEFKKAAEIEKKNSDDMDREKDEICRAAAGEMFDYGIAGKKSFSITRS